MPSTSSRPILVFDVNETLLDLQALDAPFVKALGAQDARREWFGQLLRLAMEVTILDRYRDFATLGRIALDAVAARRNVTLNEEAREQIRQTMVKLPAHPDVLPALQQLHGAGWRMVALTNSSPEMAEAQLTHAGIRPMLERVFSVDTVRRFKPAPEPYQMVTRELSADPADLLMVAAHAWDIAGAVNAGLQGAFLARRGQAPMEAFGETYGKPSFVARDLGDLASQLIASG